ncbi:MAG: extracellular solute-binding protein [Candidatus Omnitrophica bacterium]|nr:extracellular solute-binding protein [Candidatus Omnitrophota bacterium]
MPKKKYLVIIPVVVFLGFSFIGCVSWENSEATRGITVWHWMTDRQLAFEELAKRYQAISGVKVNFELYAPSEAYAQKVRAAAQGVNLPDIFGVLGEKKDFASFVKAGHILDLTRYMQESQGEWKSRFLPKAIRINEFSEENSYGVKPGIYGVPIDVVTIQMLYNKNLFRQLGLDPQIPPQSFDEFLHIGKMVKEANLQGLVSGWAEVWMIDCLAKNYAFNIMGEEKVFATIRGDVPYTDPDWIKVLSLFERMRDAGVLASGIVTMVNKTAEQLFANEKAVFAFNGSWCVNVYKGMNPNLDYAVMLPPKISDDHPMRIWGGAGSSFVVNARSKNREEAIRFLKWLTDRQQQAYLVEVTHNLPAHKDCLSQIPEILRQFADDMEITTHPNAWDVSESHRVIETFSKGIQSIIIGEKTPFQVADETQEIKRRELARK